MFREAGVPVYDADAAVHALYAEGGAAVGPVAAEFPGAVVGGAVSRPALGQLVLGDDAAMRRLEAVVHPLVEADRERFLRDAAAGGHALAVADIPLLFEKGYEAGVDAVAVASAPADVQRARVLARPGMTPEKLEAILARQARPLASVELPMHLGRGDRGGRASHTREGLPAHHAMPVASGPIWPNSSHSAPRPAAQVPDAEKRARATYVIDTGGTIEATRARVAEIIVELRGRGGGRGGGGARPADGGGAAQARLSEPLLRSGRRKLPSSKLNFCLGRS